MGPDRRLSRRRLLAVAGAGVASPVAGCLFSADDYEGHLTTDWVSETGTAYTENHHRVATADVDGEAHIAIPREDASDGEACGIVVIDAEGNEVWHDRLPAELCGGHSVADIGTGDLSGNGRPEFFLPNLTGDVSGYDAETGEETFSASVIESIGYSSPVIAELGDRDEADLIVTDFEGNLSVLRADGSARWGHEITSPVYASPIVSDVTGDGRSEIVIDHGSHPGYVVCLDGEGEEIWRTEKRDSALRMSTISLESGPAIVTTDREEAVCLAGADGQRQWSRPVGGDHADVRIGASADERVFAAASDGAVYALDWEDGSIAWSQQVSDDERMAAPAVGRITGDRDPVVIGCAYDGTVAVISAESGEILARRELDVGVFTPPVTIAQNNSSDEVILLLYEDARLAALSYEPE